MISRRIVPVCMGLHYYWIVYYKDFKYFGAASSNYVGTDREADSILTLNVDVMWPHRRPRGIQCSWFDSRSGVQSRVLHHWMPLTIDLRDYLNKVWCGTRMPLTGLWPQISIVSPKVWTCVISYFTGWATIPLLMHRDCIQVIVKTLRQLHVRSRSVMDYVSSGHWSLCVPSSLVCNIWTMLSAKLSDSTIAI